MDDGMQNAVRLFVLSNLAYKAHVDFQDIKIVILEHSERRIACSEIIQKDPGTCLAYDFQHFIAVFSHSRIGSFCDFKALSFILIFILRKLFLDPFHNLFIIKIHPGKIH